MPAKKILIVEDEEKIAQLLSDYLISASFETQIILHGDEVLPWLKVNHCDLILLDIMLPGVDGFEICKAIRKDNSLRVEANTPIIMLTARIEEIDRLIGLEIGADDYICKPFSPREVVARIKAVMRRYQPEQETGCSKLQLDEERMLIQYSDKQCELTKVEFILLQTLYRHPGHIYSRDRLMDSIYDDRHVVSDRTIDSHVKKIRKELADVGFDEQVIHSVYGAGYKFE